MNDETASMLTATGTVVGTLPYLPPEQAEGMPLDARSDVFSFGSVLYEILSGKQPFQAQSQAALLSAILRDDPKPLGEERRDIPPELRRIVTRCLKKDPQSRYPSATELAAPRAAHRVVGSKIPPAGALSRRPCSP
jgi:eukaryotic-like serine/threonine-protein kinase